MKITDTIPWRGPGRDIAARAAGMDPLRALQADVDRAFDHFWQMVQNPFASVAWLARPEAVRVDVSDNGKEMVLAAELPGLSDADIDVSIRDGQLTIRAEKRSSHDAEENGLLVKERAYGAIEQTVPLPIGVDAEAANTTFSNGVLTVVLPKSAQAQAETKRVPVQAG